MQLEDFASHPISNYRDQREETNTCLTTTSFQVAQEGNKVTSEPSVLQAKQLHFP